MLGTTRCLFVDDHHVGEMHNLTRRMNQPEKHPANPVLTPDRPWEGDSVWSKNATIWDAEEYVFKMWYQVRGETGHQTCLATSSDGVQWDRPDLGLYTWDGSTRNNMLGAEVFQIVCGPDDRGDPPAGHLYRNVSWSHEKGQFIVTSPDGVHWTGGPGVEVFGAGDTFVFTKSTQPLTGRGGLPGYPTGEDLPRYLGTARWCVGVGRFDGSSDIRPTRRVQALLTSEDLLTWSYPARILTPDGRDDEMAIDRIEDALAEGMIQQENYSDRRCEFYTMAVIPYEDLYIGMLLVFDACYENHRHGSANQQGPGHWQLVASRDLLTWQRLGDRNPFLPRGVPGQFDFGCAWYSSLPVLRDGRMWFFYSGGVYGHGTTDEYLAELKRQVAQGELPGLGCIGAATLRRDGWVSLDAGDVPGTVMTRTFRWPARGTLHLNADATGGSVYVSICQPDGTPYPGFERSEILSGDCLEAPVHFADVTDVPDPWGGPQTHGTTAETGRDRTKEQYPLKQVPYRELPDHWKLKHGLPARIKITARRAKLYSYWFA
jgi:hypothetical protein